MSKLDLDQALADYEKLLQAVDDDPEVYLTEDEINVLLHLVAFVHFPNLLAAHERYRAVLDSDNDDSVRVVEDAFGAHAMYAYQAQNIIYALRKAALA